MTRYDLIDPQHPAPAMVTVIGDRFASGQLGILPTDTVYGIMGRSDAPSVSRRIYKAKRRDTAKRLQFLLARLSQLDDLDIPLSAGLSKLATAFWPGQLTVVARNRDNVGVGVRIPNHRLIFDVINHLGQPLVASSANLSGHDPAASPADDFRDLAEAPDFIVVGGTAAGTSSTVMRLESDSFEVLRCGAISEEQIAAALA